VIATPALVIAGERSRGEVRREPVLTAIERLLRNQPPHNPPEGGTTMSTNGFTPENVIVVGFDDDDRAYEAMTTLSELASQGQLGLAEAAVVVRDDDGHIDVKDQVASEGWAGTASGGLVGLLIGILGGPLGILIGGATGLAVGSLFDLADGEDTDTALTQVSKTVKVGRTSLLAQVVEQSPEVLDSAMARLSGTVVRRSVADVEAEIAAAEAAQREAKRKARAELHKARHEKRQEEAHAKVEELKAKLHPDRKAPAGA
jgi:uncharacterized membrane protein